MRLLSFCTIMLVSSLLNLLLPQPVTAQVNSETPLKIGVVGLTHTHVHWILGRPDRGDIEIVGIAEPNKDLAMRYIEQHKLDKKLWYPSMAAMVKATQPEAVCAFGSIYEHLEVVEYCAPQGIHVMVEKPLAVSKKHADKMAKLARQHNIHLLTNYETTWYASNHKAYELAHQEKSIGAIRKVVIHDGHRGPKEIGCNEEFLEWLTDPVLNGAGALTDFGCYGANLMTWLMNGQKPIAVTAITQQIKPEVYPKVDDEATILLTYPKAQAIIQASWNWPISRKDMEVYGLHGQLIAKDGQTLHIQEKEGSEIEVLDLPALKAPYDDPFAYLRGVVHGTIIPHPTDLSSLENNLTVVEILDAAKKSARTGKSVKLK